LIAESVFTFDETCGKFVTVCEPLFLRRIWPLEFQHVFAGLGLDDRSAAHSGHAG
jgi:hypothetical protein